MIWYFDGNMLIFCLIWQWHHIIPTAVATLGTSRDTMERSALVEAWSHDVPLSNSVIPMRIMYRHVLSFYGNSQEEN